MSPSVAGVAEHCETYRLYNNMAVWYTSMLCVAMLGCGEAIQVAHIDVGQERYWPVVGKREKEGVRGLSGPVLPCSIHVYKYLWSPRRWDRVKLLLL